MSGTAVVTIKPGKKLEHAGIKVELMGRLIILTDNAPPYTFFTISKDLEPPGKNIIANIVAISEDPRFLHNTPEWRTALLQCLIIMIFVNGFRNFV